MAKVLITSIGTGDIKKDSDSDYHETTYLIEGKKYKNTLTSQVIVEHYGIQKIIFIGTTGSMWDNLYFKYGGEDEPYMDLMTQKKHDGTLTQEDLEPFLKQIDTFLGYKGSKCFLLDYNEKDKKSEVWENFEKLLGIKKYIKDGDELYLDITHGFRYLPILNIFLLESLKALYPDNFQIKAILYGMFAGDESEIINFKIFLDLLEWIKAVNNFKKYADGWHLAKLLENEDQDAANVLTQFSDTFHLANMHALWGFMKDINRKLKKLEKVDNKILKFLSDEIGILAKRFDKEKKSDFQFELAKWLKDSNNYALSYIALYEAIITKSCELKGKGDCNDYEVREEAKKSIGNDKYGKYFYTKYDDSISQIRNAIVHQNSDRKELYKQDIKRLDKFLEHFEEYFNQGKS